MVVLANQNKFCIQTDEVGTVWLSSLLFSRKEPDWCSSTDSALLKTETLKAFDKKHVFWKCKFWL